MAKTPKNPIENARRYMIKAREILSTKAIREGDYYNNQKHVKSAGKAAWKGCVLALESVLEIKGTGYKSDILQYCKEASKIDKELNTNFIDSAYLSLHNAMGYDGCLLFSIVSTSLSLGDEVIDWCEKYYEG